MCVKAKSNNSDSDSDLTTWTRTQHWFLYVYPECCDTTNLYVNSLHCLIDAFLLSFSPFVNVVSLAVPLSRQGRRLDPGRCIITLIPRVRSVCIVLHHIELWSVSLLHISVPIVMRLKLIFYTNNRSKCWKMTSKSYFKELFNRF